MVAKKANSGKPKRKASFITKMMVLVNIVFALLLITSYCALYISPIAFWPLGFAGLAYPVFLVINMIFMMLWMFFFKKYFFISLITILLGFNHIKTFIKISDNRNTMLTENSLTVMSYNVRLFDLYNWRNSAKDQTSRDIFNLIANEKPEILCIQDYYNGNGRSTNLADSIKKYGHFAYQDVQLINKPDHGLPYGLAIFSKYPIISQQKVDFPDTRANFCHSVDIVYQKDTVRICNLHFESIKFGKADYDFVSQMTNTPAANEKTKRSLRTIVGKMRSAYKKRAVQAKIVAQYIQSSPYPIILAGDFNDTPVSYTYRQIDEKLDDSFAEIGFGIGQSHYQMLPILRIDYIFHSKQFKPISYQTIRKDFSDHFPIVARFVPNN